MEGYVSVKEAAEELNVSKSRVFHMIRDGIIEAEKVGNVYVISESEVERRKLTNPGPGNRSEYRNNGKRHE